MITITIDSLAISLDLLKSVDLNEHLIFLNDGYQSAQIRSFKAISESPAPEEAETSDMPKNKAVSYELNLQDNRVILFGIENSQVKVTALDAKPTTTIRNMPNRVADYAF
ncbi:hypothetical protein M9194_06810 [Vibrio sp. S4M6]|uniref:hypothetical protein n=1 Tax=Vibrio sinus TaxID=2946865 RepID=UPI002029EFED|nr:hypothetical protein [Vibrio sinus]MCL9781135.1 hypothetical protein [Vibrio sinus]